MASTVEQTHTFKVGDFLYSSWGYDQTNVEFYRVVAVTAKTVTLREVQGNYQHDGIHGGKATPTETFKSEQLLRRTVRHGSVRIDDCSRAYRYDGAPKYFSCGA